MIDEILVISCPVLGRTRWSNIYDRLRSLDVKVTKHPGVSKYKLTSEQKQKFNTHYSDGTSCCKWPEGEMAVALAHYNAWQYVTTKQQWCCILEDDAIVNDDLNIYLNKFISDDEVGLISLFPDGIKNGVNSVIEHKPYTNHGLVGYLINPYFAEYLINNFNTISKPVDHYVYETQSNYKLLYTSTRYITHDNTKCSLRSIASN